MSGQVIFVEDDDELRRATTQAMEIAGFTVTAFPRADLALRSISGAFDGVIVSDIRLPGMDGIQFLDAVRSIDADIPLILVTGHADVAMAVAALKAGAFDFLSKPFATDHLTASIQRGIERRALQIENRKLRAAADASDAASPLVGASVAVARLRSVTRQLAAADLDVLVEGETGVGKELVAHLLHRLGPRAGRPFVAVNCAAWAEGNFELALFGHAADTISHARMARRGQIAASSGGTLLLDEIDSMPLGLQAQLLRVLEEREVQPLGAELPEPIDLRVVATSKVDLEAEAASGRFRSDLFHRLAMTRIRVPPLREREDDAALLFDLFVEEAKDQLGRPDYRAPRAVQQRVRRHDWPGNVRELRNYAFSAVLGQATSDAGDMASPRSLKERVAAFEAVAIADALAETGGNVGQAMDRLGLPRKTFYDKVARLKLDLPALRKGDGEG